MVRNDHFQILLSLSLDRVHLAGESYIQLTSNRRLTLEVGKCHPESGPVNGELTH
jgi:hypothetical protein